MSRLPCPGKVREAPLALAAILLVLLVDVPAVGARGADSPAAVAAPLSASISSNVSSGWLPLTVGFYSNVSGGVPPYTYDWNFADGCTCEYSQNATHTFVKTGTFMVRFTATDHSNDTVRQWVNITVRDPTLSSHPSGGSFLGGSATDWATILGGIALVGLAVAWSEWRRRR
jgi:PKD repeat protein